MGRRFTSLVAAGLAVACAIGIGGQAALAYEPPLLTLSSQADSVASGRMLRAALYPQADIDVNPDKEGSQTELLKVGLKQNLNFKYYDTSRTELKAWDLTRCDGSDGVSVKDTNVSVAVIDSGVYHLDDKYGIHEDLIDNVLCEYDAFAAVTGEGDVNTTLDLMGNGTKVAGAVSAKVGNGMGTAGYSYNAKIIPINIYSHDESNAHATQDSMLRALDYVLENREAKNIRVAVIGNSSKLEDAEFDWSADPVCNKISALRDAGVLVVAPAGYRASNADPYATYPSDYDDCLSVMSVWEAEQYTNSDLMMEGYVNANYNQDGVTESSVNQTKDLVAPGRYSWTTCRYFAVPYIISTQREVVASQRDGVGVATGAVAGVAAMCFAEDPSLSPDDVQNLLQTTATTRNLPTPYPVQSGQSMWGSLEGWTSRYGHGEVNAYEAVSHIMNNMTIADVPDQANLGAPAEPKFEITTPTGETLQEGVDYTVEYEDNTGLGTATAVVKGTGSYVGTVMVPFEITSAVESVTAKYDGAGHVPTVTLAESGATLLFSNDEGETYDSEEPTPVTDAGEHTFYYQLAIGDVVTTGTATVTIDPRDITLTSASATKDNDGRPLTAHDVSVGGDGWAAGEGATYTFTGSQTTQGSSPNYFTYQLNANTKASNYSITTSFGTLTVLGGAPAPAPTFQGHEMHRLYNPNSGEHFYTTSAGERDAAVAAGWLYEGIGWTAPVPTQGIATKPVYRLYNQFAGDHHYTQSLEERNALIGFGWTYEGVGWYSGGPTPLWRQYNPNAVTGTHNYTPSTAERQGLVALGWKDEGVAWYGL